MDKPKHFAAHLLELKNEFDVHTLDKGDFLLQPGEIEKNLYFIESGAVRVLLLNEFEEHTIRLGYTNSFINSLSSYLRQEPSEFYLEILRKTTLRAIPRRFIEELINDKPELLKAYNGMLEELVTQQIDREIDILTSSPSQRLERVLKRSPRLFQEVPHKYIASYLRMAPETLSRLQKS